ncbi:hypothetical protein IKE_05948 [Bacillus cereus VD196]|uniref:DDE domain-containing protein n=1 Tax=Bacillus cereus VD196 TaxID=1053243 RepID=A0A9W5PYA3_BACCE|nr:hypothetical protein IKG_05955 [Bacillus cereus VD200]EOO60748.1 hypothetical protein IKE_05948 [Bacillus cereus VD196]
MKGEWRYLYRAIDTDGYTLDIQLRKKRDNQAAYSFMKRLVKTFREPTVLITDKSPALLWEFGKLRKNNFYKHTTHCTIKHLNNCIEQEHRHVKRQFAKSAGFKIFGTLHVQSKESKLFMLYIRKTGVLNQTPVFRRAVHYKIIYSCIIISEKFFI